VKPRLAIASQKGGVGKTTIALNLAVALAKAGYRTLLIDTDPQGALNLSLAKGHRELTGLVEALVAKGPPVLEPHRTGLPGLSLLPKGRLSMKQVPLFERLIYGGERFTRLLDEAERDHDLTVIDTPAGLGMVTRAVLGRASHVLVPLKVDTMSLRSVNQILEVIRAIRADENPDLEFLGLLLNMMARDREADLAVAAEVWRDFTAVFDTVIPDHPIFARALEHGTPLAFLGAGDHPEARRFDLLAEETLRLIRCEEASHVEARPLL